MPNHISNLITIKFTDKKEVSDIISKILDKEKNVDFNTLIPMPLYIYRGDLGEKEERIFGDNNWYKWARHNWGTKWNAYNTKKLKWTKDTVEIYFETAWNLSQPFITAFANFSQLEFDVDSYDEGDNFGVSQHWNKGTLVSYIDTDENKSQLRTKFGFDKYDDEE